MATRPPLKLLMLHGYTQSGPLFHAKSRALIKHITKAFPLHEVSALYPTGPLRLNPADIPGYTPQEGSGSGAADSEETEIESYGWYRRSNTAEPPLYVGLEDGLDTIAKVLSEEGPFDGVIGFSQGAAMAAMVVSLLEEKRQDAFAHFASSSSSGVEGFAYPASFAKLSHPALKFAVCYSGFRSPGDRYRAFYESPPIQTPVLHVLGSLDAVVEESRSRSLIEACVGDPEAEGKVVWHPGGHFLPSQRPYLDAAVRFIRECLDGAVQKDNANHEEDVNDMDLPF
ncbi:serine hydrolase FSH [Aspergillus pseudodeflectus]|uniref:Serine hydrolase FSH n=1 Tax=Aspergillus pseudodeflectus TaxID=176178 RepID=A0ABR4L7V9_9EURO